jgi:hypothetical protein
LPVDLEQILPCNKDAKVHDFDSALAFIKAGQTPDEKRYLYDRGLTLYLIDSETIHLRYNYHSFVFLTYKPNGVVILPDTTNWRAMRPSIRRVVAQYANLKELGYKNGKYYLHRSFDPTTPLKVRRCSKCRGQGTFTFTCNGDSSPYRTIKTFDNRSIGIFHHCTNNNTSEPHREIAACSSCKETGKIQWGGKNIPTEWDGKPLRLDIATGFILDEEPTEG